MVYSLNLKHLPLALVLAVSVLTTFPWLNFPAEVIFDEVHFGKFVTAYCCSGERIFDIHPPHGKLIIAASAWLGGYRGGFAFDHIGEQYGTTPVVALRFVPALMGAALPLLIFALIRQLGGSPPAAALAAAAIALDNAFKVQSRLIAIDSVLLLATFASLSVFLAAMKFEGANYKRWLLWLLAGCLAGLAAGVKFTGLAAIALLSVIILAQLGRTVIANRQRGITPHRRRRISSWITAGLIILLGAAGVYVLGWWLHFALLTQPGSGDAWGIPSGNFWQDINEVHRTMLEANYNLAATHPYSSRYLTWPIMVRPIFYWQSVPEGQEAPTGMIYFLGNPVVWWGATALFVVAVIHTMLGSLTVSKNHSRTQTAVPSSSGWLLLAGYVISYAPFINVPRALFLYHYLTPLVFSLMFGLLWLDGRLLKRQKTWKHLPAWYVFILAAIIAGFVFFAPLTYGLPAAQWSPLLFWLPTWR